MSLKLSSYESRTRVSLVAAFAVMGFVARPAEAQRQVLSPRDSAVQVAGSARIAVDYSRPSKRGREIFGALVPWNRVWRTGANSATTLVTTRDLVIGRTPVPAGTYTLYTLPSPTGWKLIVNKQTGQWGTEYNEAEDLARIDMSVETLKTPTEQFTIRLDPSANGGVMRLVWDTTQASVPYTIKR